MEKTKLTRRQYLAKVNKWLAENQDQWQQIRATQKYPYSYLQSVVSSALGEPWWRDKPGRNKITGSMPTDSDPGVGFKLYPVANGKVGAKSDPTRKATRGNPTKESSGTRQYIERATSPPDTDFHASDRRMGEANTRGFDGGHKTHLGRQLAGQEFKVQEGRGTVQEYQANFRNAGLPFGHTVENIEDQAPEDNRIRQPKDYAKLDKALADMEIDLPRTDSLIEKSKTAVARAARRVAPGPASVVPGLVTTGLQIQETIANPTPANIRNSFFDAANSLADIGGLHPLTAAPSEAIQRALDIGQMGANANDQLQRLQINPPSQ